MIVNDVTKLKQLLLKPGTELHIITRVTTDDNISIKANKLDLLKQVNQWPSDMLESSSVVEFDEFNQWILVG